MRNMRPRPRLPRNVLRLLAFVPAALVQRRASAVSERLVLDNEEFEAKPMLPRDRLQKLTCSQNLTVSCPRLRFPTE